MLALVPLAFTTLALSPLLPSPTPDPAPVVPGATSGTGSGCLLQVPRAARSKFAYLSRARVTFMDPTGGLMGAQQQIRWEVRQPPQRPLVQATFFIDRVAALTVTTPDADGTFALESPPGYFTAGSHQVGVRLFGLNDEYQDLAFDIDVSPCPITQASATVARRPKQLGHFTWAAATDSSSAEPDITAVAITATAGAVFVLPARTGATLGALDVTGPGKPALHLQLRRPRRGTVLAAAGTVRVRLQAAARTVSVTGLPPGSTAGTLDLTRGAVRGVGTCWTAAFRVGLRGGTGAVTIPVADRRRCR